MKGEPFFLEWLQHSSWKEDTKLGSKVIYFQSMLPIQIEPTPNPCGLLFLDSKRAGQHLAQLAPNPRARRAHSTFLLLLWNSSIPNMEDFYQGAQLTGKEASCSLTMNSIKGKHYLLFITNIQSKEQELEKHLGHEALPKSHGQCCSYLKDVLFLQEVLWSTLDDKRNKMLQQVWIQSFKDIEEENRKNGGRSEYRVQGSDD